ncbi:hypothetical protein XBKQ1_1890003 [Xenorhabdus bovienii str. kraussei Quebec]|uniref:Uncharacterized protein n=1 Tax=Xenorhabdus bovienii str. kraussei Quebec TaxID=1398203 RepID=A0A077PER4_XENBV|nr:hypothetical protein XBKQ1_1890003 [Xenorhabdus bovienii str. kraussei Quebec]
MSGDKSGLLFYRYKDEFYEYDIRFIDIWEKS